MGNRISSDAVRAYFRNIRQPGNPNLKKLTNGVALEAGNAMSNLRNMERAMAKRGPVYLGNSDSGTGIQVAPGKKGEQGENTTEE